MNTPALFPAAAATVAACVHGVIGHQWFSWESA
jgi:hypothetical protein